MAEQLLGTPASSNSEDPTARIQFRYLGTTAQRRAFTLKHNTRYFYRTFYYQHATLEYKGNLIGR